MRVPLFFASTKRGDSRRRPSGKTRGNDLELACRNATDPLSIRQGNCKRNVQKWCAAWWCLMFFQVCWQFLGLNFFSDAALPMWGWMFYKLCVPSLPAGPVMFKSWPTVPPSLFNRCLWVEVPTKSPCLECFRLESYVWRWRKFEVWSLTFKTRGAISEVWGSPR